MAPLSFLFDAGRHHANLQALPGGGLVSTVVVRDDFQKGVLASYRRGMDALVSTSNGTHWSTDRRYELDRFPEVAYLWLEQFGPKPRFFDEDAVPEGPDATPGA